jgi:phospholipid transport system transporter-binding protein
MIRREGDRLIVDGAVTVDTVPAMVDEAEPHLGEGVRTIDFAGVTQADSSAVALVLEWLRRAQQRNVAVRLANLPAAMQNLAKLYGVDELLQPVLN